ncbi:MAG TPA: ATP-binding cassette domain-containing protein [Candidatus Limnocylindria bacterium]|nr:ATP-binding cassette domain-containing protein [Candidatus Limnocylindria bacterium]
MPISTPDALWSSPAARRLRPVAIEISGLARTVGGEALLDGVDLAIAAGARVLVAGLDPNAPSLLLRIMAGLARADRGTVVLAGLLREASIPEGWARRIGFVGADPGIPLWMTPAESLDLAARLAGIDGPQRQRLIDTSLQNFQLGAIRDRPLRHAGRNIAERTALAAALLPDPEVLLLDEPLRAHPPPDRLRLLRIPGERRTVLIASRFPAQEGGIVDRVVLIRDGRVALHAPIEELDAQRLPLSLRGMTALADLGLVGQQ